MYFRWKRFNADGKAFPGIKKWHQRVITALQTTGKIITCFGRERIFFGKPDDNSTIREAIAFEPQSTIADILNLAAYKVQRRWHGGTVKCMAQLHDAILVSYPEEQEDSLVPLILKEMTIPVPCHGHYDN